jgi:SRSO17 transposase
MDKRTLTRLEKHLDRFLDEMTRDEYVPRRRSMALYVTGLLLDGERKSVAPMAARLAADPAQVEAVRQQLQECVVISGWADDRLRQRLALKVDRELPSIEAFVIDDTGFPKKGKQSVGVFRQYSGTLGRTENCQVATSLHLAGEHTSACIALRLYLPEIWANDPARRAKAGVPEEVQFQRKWEIALHQLRDALSWGVQRHVVIADAGYGDAVEFREGLSALGLLYLLAVAGSHVVWPPGSNPQRPEHPLGKRGRPRTRYEDPDHEPVAIATLASALEPSAFRKVAWRDSSRGRLSSRFAFLRVRTASGHTKGRPPSDMQWLVCEWPKGEQAPTKFYISTMPASTSQRTLVRLIKTRWRVERDYQELKQEVGLDHYEGRTWRGFHHHATLCAVAHAFLALSRALSPPAQCTLDPAHGSPHPPDDPGPSGRYLPALQAPG